MNGRERRWREIDAKAVPDGFWGAYKAVMAPDDWRKPVGIAFAVAFMMVGCEVGSSIGKGQSW
jgi:hypothetical protein